MCLACYGGLVHINGSVRVQAALGLARGHRCCVCPYCNYGLCGPDSQAEKLWCLWPSAGERGIEREGETDREGESNREGGRV